MRLGLAFVSKSWLFFRPFEFAKNHLPTRRKVLILGLCQVFFSVFLFYICSSVLAVGWFSKSVKNRNSSGKGHTSLRLAFFPLIPGSPVGLLLELKKKTITNTPSKTPEWPIFFRFFFCPALPHRDSHPSPGKEKKRNPAFDCEMWRCLSLFSLSASFLFFLPV